ncbi:MAG: hypothetical protein GC203_16345 [Phenylobacterium sp.]|uniref:hypothetical protein n=1 Tax=Phenylobacterium sp. TaxID=1871053 RepID=UPI0025F1A171|nr:hypothetical protein [Phenylobacterium sp.]MBI1199432.1 hypothetical protein [Phenylobacterium sp.]
MTDPGSRNGHAVQRFFGVLLVAAGALIGGLSGLCTLFGVGAGLLEMLAHPGDGLSFIGIALAVGAIPIIVGVGLFIAGRGLVRGAGPPSGPATSGDTP